MTKKKILLIEDDMATIEVYKIGLENAGFDVDPITTGAEAIRTLRDIDSRPEEKPDIVLLDMILPDILGIEILKKIRSFKNIKDLRVLILSNYTDKELEAKGLLLNSEKYLLKTDYKPSDLAKIVKKELKC